MIIFLTFSNKEEQDKFEYLYNKYKKLLLHKAHSILNDYSYAEDAVSEAYLRIYKNLGKIDDADSNMTVSFLVTIVKNVALTQISKNKSNLAANIEDYELKDDYNLEGRIVSSARTKEMLTIVGKLKEELRAPFLLMYAHGLSHREIGRLLGINENNVTVRIHRAKKKIMDLIGKEGSLNE